MVRFELRSELCEDHVARLARIEKRGFGSCIESARKSGVRRPEFGTADTLPEGSFEFVVQDFSACLELEVSAAQSPLHLLLFDELHADNLVDCRFDEFGTDSFTLPVTIAEVGNEPFIVLYVGVTLRSNRGNQSAFVLNSRTDSRRGDDS